MKYTIIFWGNSSNRRKIFTLQKKIIRIMVSVKNRNSCRSLFKSLENLTTLPCGYIVSLLNFIVNDQEHFQTNLALHIVNTRNRHDFHRPSANLPWLQKSACYSGIKILNNLICSLKSLVKKNVQFKAALKRYLNTYSFYSFDEFLMFKN
jgi:hypothetical protein